MGGETYVLGPFCAVLIKPKYKSDTGLLQHELTHVEQNLRTWGLHPLKYHSSDKYRLESEAEAYAVQLSHSNDKTTDYRLFINYMVRKYRLPYGSETVRSAFNRWIKK